VGREGRRRRREDVDVEGGVTLILQMFPPSGLSPFFSLVQHVPGSKTLGHAAQTPD
jgi:hypothetical protein